MKLEVVANTVVYSAYPAYEVWVSSMKIWGQKYQFVQMFLEESHLPSFVMLEKGQIYSFCFWPNQLFRIKARNYSEMCLELTKCLVTRGHHKIHVV